VRSQLSERDVQVLRAVEKVRLLNARQVERLIFTEGSPLTRARRCRATLDRLTRWRCLGRLERRVGGVRAGSAGFVYFLLPFGHRVLHPGAEHLQRTREPSRAFVDHTLAISELWVELTEAERRGDLELLDFQPEPSSWRSFSGIGGDRRWVKPDARVTVVAGEWEQHCFVEVDLGTESGTVIRRKAEAFVAYWQTGIEQQRDGVYPRVVFLVPDDARRGRLVDALGRLPAEHWQVFQIDLLERAVTAIRGRARKQARNCNSTPEGSINAGRVEAPPTYKERS
jgi:hypothetical protein